MKRGKAVVIGSGVAGLAGAIRLAVQGFDVEVFEKNKYPGGKLSFFEKDGFAFDKGPSLFTQPQLLHDLFAKAGERLEDYISYKKIEIACKYFYENGTVINGFTNSKLLAEELSSKLQEENKSVQQYLYNSKKLYENVGSVFLNHSLHKRSTWLQKHVLKALQTVRLPHITGTLHSLNKTFFRSPEAVQLFDRYATYNGSNPYKTPGMMSLIPHLELNDGTFYPLGGMISITKALFDLAKKKNVVFHFNTPVQRIIHHQRNVNGIVANNENIQADVVLSNADVYFTYKNLLNDLQQKKTLKQERSSSGIIFYWGMNREFEQLHLHNIFFSNNYAAEFQSIFKQKILYHDPTVYVNITSKMEKNLAPAGKENWFVLMNTPSDSGHNWQQMRLQMRSFVIEKLSRMLQTNIEHAIEMEEFLDPVRIEEETGSLAGSLYGTSSNSKMAAFLRHPNFSSHIKGLYFCGGSVHPGGGIPLCLHSAKIATDLIAEKKSKLHLH